MAFSVNDNGTWKTVKKLSVNDGTWKAVKSGWINKDGVWTKFYASDTSITITGGNNIDLRSLYQSSTGDYSSTPVDVNFIVTGNVGSTSTGTASIVTGAWPIGSNITLTNNAIIAGKGGNGGTGNGGTSSPCSCFGSSGGFTGADAGTNGGNAISLGYALVIINNGTIGGGGGGGTSVPIPYSVFNVLPARGGGGAGLNVGLAGGEGTCGRGRPGQGGFGTNGTATTGGAGAVMPGGSIYAGSGGNLGQSSTPGRSNYYDCKINSGFRNTSTQSPGYALVRNNNTYTLQGNALVGPII